MINKNLIKLNFLLILINKNRFQIDNIEYHLDMGKRKLEQFKNQNVLNVSFVQVRRRDDDNQKGSNS